MDGRKHLILASASPRRSDLLGRLGFEFEVRATDVDEVLPEGYPADRAARYLAELKASASEPWLDGETVILTADTTVVIDDRVINKPTDVGDALHMLHELCGATHTVVTGVCIVTRQAGNPRRTSFSVATEVTVAEATEDEIASYVDRCRPFDKAGGYGIQDWIGWAKVTAIDGSYSNVMGLPTAEVYAALRDIGLMAEIRP